jgi:futalosine hydrolase
MLAAALTALPEAIVLPIATSGRVGGGREHQVEAMEGFGVLRASELAGVAAIEIRVISNNPAETDRSQWHIEDALAVLHDTIRSVVPALLNNPTTTE